MGIITIESRVLNSRLSAFQAEDVDVDDYDVDDDDDVLTWLDDSTCTGQLCAFVEGTSLELIFVS